MGLDLNTALISDTFDGLIKTTDGNALTGSPLVLTDGRGNDSSLALATAGNGVTITGTLTVGGVDIGGDLATAKSDITAIETKTNFITVTGAVNLDTIKTKADFITVTQAVDLDTIESDIASATAKTQYITVTQAVNLDTMESDILSAKTKTDFITIGQPVNLDNVESGLATAEADIIAIEAKTDFITVTGNVNLDTVASNASAAKTKTDFLTVTQAVDLDTLESDVNVAKGDITAIEAKTDNITVTQAVNLDTMESDLASSKAKTDFITITQAVNLDTVESGLSQAQTDINLIEAKTNNITVTQAVNLDTMESDIATNNAKNSYPAGDATKVGFISVTQAVDLDSMETDISNLSANKYDKTGGTISGAVTITGDLTVNGTTTTVNTQTLSVKDPLIELANDNSANSVDTGFYANYSDDAGVTTKYAGLFKDAGDSDKFKLFKGLEVEPTTTVDTAGTGYTKGDLVVANLDATSANISGVIEVVSSDQCVAKFESTGAGGGIALLDSTTTNADQVGIGAFGDNLCFRAGGDADGNMRLHSTGNLTIGGDLSDSGNMLDVRGDIISSGDVEGATLTGTLSTAAQTNITSVGTLSSLTVAGALNGTISTAAQPNITSVGNLSSLNVNGNTTVSNNSTVIIDVSDADFPFIGSTGSSNDDLIVGSWGDVIINADYNNSTAQNIIFKEGTSELMRIDSAGNLGIGGVADADFRLHIYKSTNAEMAFESTGSGGGFFRIGTGSTGSGFDGALRIYDINAGAERMRINASGNVGIGTSSPNLKLHVTQAAGSAQMRLERTVSNAGSMILGADGDGLKIFNSSVQEKFRFLQGGGITFNGDTAAANALDDYEEGTWTPGITFGGASVGVTYDGSFNGGIYTKVGRVVTINGWLALTNKGTSTGGVRITGLPFAVANLFGAYLGVSLGRISAISYTGQMNASTGATGTEFTLYETTEAGVIGELQNTDFVNNSSVMFSLTYMT